MTSAYPPLRPFAPGEIVAPTGAQSRELDRIAIEERGVPQSVLMENAGRSAASVAARLFPSAVVLGFVGAGNNGGDALVMLRTLASWGARVRGVLVSDAAPPLGLLHGWSVPLVHAAELDDAGWRDVFHGVHLLVDGVLGTGIRGAPRPAQARVIERINAHAAPVLSIDVPSGIDADAGAVAGAAVRADVTVTFGAPKLGALLHPARALVGRLVCTEIGFPPWTGEAEGAGLARLVTPAWAQERLPARSPSAHKNAVGRVSVLGGRPGMAGAVVLAARAAFAAGAGYVRVCSDDANRTVLQAAVPEAVFVDTADAGGLREALLSSDAVVAGPGLGTGEDAAELLRGAVAAGDAPLLLDADALNLAAAGAVDVAAVARARPVLLTPHPGEMARLVRTDAAAVVARRPEVAADAAARWGAAVLLKGNPSVVAAPGAPLLVDTQGSSDLAVAGMGDTLAGTCGTFLAQGVAPQVAGALGLFYSGRAGRLAGRGRGLTPGDVVRWLPEALRERGPGVSDLELPGVVLDADPSF